MSESNSKTLFGWHREIDSHRNVRYVSMSGQVFYNVEAIVDYMSPPTNCKCWQSGIINFQSTFDFNPDSIPEMSTNGTPQKRTNKCKEWLSKLTPKQYEDLVRQMLLYFAVYSSGDLEEIYYIVKNIKKETKDDNQSKEERTKITAWFREFDYDDFIYVNGSLWKTPLKDDQIVHALYELYHAKQLPFNFDNFINNRDINYNPVIVSGPIQSYNDTTAQQIQYSSMEIINSPPRLNSVHRTPPQQSPQHQMPVEQIISYDPTKIPIVGGAIENNRINPHATIDILNNNNDLSAKTNPTMLNNNANKRISKPRNRKQSPVKASLPSINEQQPQQQQPHVMSPTRPFYYNYQTNNFIFPFTQPIHSKAISTSTGLPVSVPGGNQPVIIVNNTANNSFSHNHTITFDTINSTHKTISPTKMVRTTSIMQPQPNTTISAFSLLTSKHDPTRSPPIRNPGISTISFINPMSVTNHHSIGENKHPINVIPLSVVQNIPTDRLTNIPQPAIIPEPMPKPKRPSRARGKRNLEDSVIEQSLNNGSETVQHPLPNQKPVQVGFPNSTGKIVPIFNGVILHDNHPNEQHVTAYEICEPGFESSDSTPCFKISKFTILNESEK